MKKMFIIISHYFQLAKTIEEYLTKMLPLNEEMLKIVALGGINNRTELGTDPTELMDVINSNKDIEEVFIFSDLGSATLSAISVSSMIEDKKIYVSKGSIVENSFSAYVLANSGASFEEISKASEEAIQK
ncbi:PTS-dependent dihydroxyacetone kinase phosphotransferase subunit DhaM [Mesomycoplasma molare]|uniref:Dihydroxyacetone kinase n=1 Tax=Mesomycoplasma molare TaxID=171288 RepID=A0ABY5TV83_9BACT|nr:dihydroxyacetone kinase [Mesomycoplasma molare]UWD34552.1 dihydroxyacetone kinase [Mesomycoplasma molare]